MSSYPLLNTRCIIIFLALSLCTNAQTTARTSQNPPAPPSGHSANKAAKKKVAGARVTGAETPAPKVQTVPAKFAIVYGDFSQFNNDSYKKELISVGGDIVITASDGTIIDGTTAKLISLANDQATIQYQPSSGSGEPATVYIGLSGKAKTMFSLTGASTTRHLVIAGAFCESQTTDPCSSTGQTTAKAYVYANPGGVSYQVDPNTLKLGPKRAEISFTAPLDFQPTTITFGGVNANNFPLIPAHPLVPRQVVYQAFDLASMCRPDETAADCLIHIDLSAPESPDAVIHKTAMQDTLLFVNMTIPDGNEPNTLIATRAPSTNATAMPGGTSKTDTRDRSSLILRRTTRPAADQSLLNVDMTLMDQETVRRDFGRRIAEHYLAVSLEVSNRTTKKLQFNKSAIWFDADYRAVGGPTRSVGNVFATTFSGATANTLFSPSVYGQPFHEYSKSDYNFCQKHSNLVLVQESSKNHNQSKLVIKTPSPPDNPSCDEIFYRYGIEQSLHLSPMKYDAILAAFDYTTERTDRSLRFIELLGATLIPISGSSIVAQVHNTAFHDSISLFTGTFLPGYRALELDPAQINRLRSNLVTQTMQETVQIPPSGFTSTIVLLPRDGVLGFRGRDQSVVVDRLIDVHIDPDVINGTKDAAVPADIVNIGYSMDQVRQALGEPHSITPNDSAGTTEWDFATGTYKSVSFNKDGKVIDSSARSLDEQLALQPSLAEATTFLTKNKLSYTRLSLTNGNSILVDIPTVKSVPLFDVKDKQVQGGYTLLYDKIRTIAKAMPSPSIVDFNTALKGLHLGDTPYPEPPTVAGSMNTITFTMPDIVGGSIWATLDTTKKLVTDVSFKGTKPSSVK